MATVKLPQTKNEIRAATDEILIEIHSGRWAEEGPGRELRTSRLDVEDDDGADFVREWLHHIARMGAIDRCQLATLATLALGGQCEGVRRIGGARVASVLARGRWRYSYGGYV